MWGAFKAACNGPFLTQRPSGRRWPERMFLCAPGTLRQRYWRMARTRRTPALEDSSFMISKRPSSPVWLT
jgi:hypothetical protein